LPPATFVDVEAALEGAHRAESCIAEERWAQAWGPAGIAYHVATRPSELAPYRESGHRLLMEALQRRGNVAEALRAYERLRVLLREELGIAPSPTVQAVHRRLLDGAGS
jgi:two-component SAPR family response regulator